MLKAKVKLKTKSRVEKKTLGLVGGGDLYRLEKIPLCFGNPNSNSRCEVCNFYLACLEGSRC